MRCPLYFCLAFIFNQFPKIIFFKRLGIVISLYIICPTANHPVQVFFCFNPLCDDLYLFNLDHLDHFLNKLKLFLILLYLLH